MAGQTPDVEAILQGMAAQLGEEPRPMALTARVVPQWIPRQAQERAFIFDLPAIPAKYKHVLMIAVAAATGSHECTKAYSTLATRAGVTKEEIGEALLTARYALGSTVFATAVEGLGQVGDRS